MSTVGLVYVKISRELAPFVLAITKSAVDGEKEDSGVGSGGESVSRVGPARVRVWACLISRDPGRRQPREEVEVVLSPGRSSQL